jgi:hypothetical protein
MVSGLRIFASNRASRKNSPRAVLCCRGGCALQHRDSLLCDLHRDWRDRVVRAEMPTPAVRADRARDWMTEQLRTAASPRLCAYLVAPGLQPTFIAWQRLWRPTLASRGVCWRSIIAATANPNMTAIPTTTRFLWALADLSAVIIGKV